MMDEDPLFDLIEKGDLQKIISLNRDVIEDDTSICDFAIDTNPEIGKYFVANGWEFTSCAFGYTDDKQLLKMMIKSAKKFAEKDERQWKIMNFRFLGKIKDMKIINLYIDTGLPINIYDITSCALYNNLPVLKTFMNIKKNIILDNEATFYACSHGNIEMLKFIEEKGGPKPDVVDMTIALMYQRTECVKYLLGKGCEYPKNIIEISRSDNRDNYPQKLYEDLELFILYYDPEKTYDNELSKWLEDNFHTFNKGKMTQEVESAYTRMY